LALARNSPQRAGSSRWVFFSNHPEANKKPNLLKRHGYIYEGICDLENIKCAVAKASLGKRDHTKVKRVLDHTDRYALEIQKMLVDQTFEPTRPKEKTILDGPSGKTRTICRPSFFPDQIVHWAIMLQLEPIMMRGMYQYNCGSVPGRGTSHGQKALRKWLDKDPKNTKYCLKMDVRKFYPSVKGEHLKPYFRRKIKDERCLWLVDAVIDSADGLPIGYYTSQWFSNFFLEDLDHFIKEELGAKHYVRYVDDLVVLGPNKKKLHRARADVEAFLSAKGLHLKDNWQVFPVSKRDIDFLGMRFYRDRTLLRKRNALRIRRRARRIAKKRNLSVRDASAMVSYWGWIKRTDSYTFYHKYIKPAVSITEARKVVSIDARYRRANPCCNGRRESGGLRPDAEAR